MDKISDNVSEKLEKATEETLKLLDPFQELKNNSVKENKSRKRKKKENIKVQNPVDEDILKCGKSTHIIAIVDWDDDENNINHKIEIPDDILVNNYDIETISNYLSDTTGFLHKGFKLKWPHHYENHDEFCKWEIEKAHLNNKKEPDFDYRMFYERGDNIYLVRYYNESNLKEIMNLKVRTVYPRSMVCVFKEQWCQCVGFSDRDNIFYNRQEAEAYFNSIDAEVEERIEND